MSEHEMNPHGASAEPQAPLSGKFTLSVDEINSTFEMLGLSDEAKRAEFTNLRSLASGFQLEQRTRSTSDSVTDSEEQWEE